jgi:hypothetical protein
MRKINWRKQIDLVLLGATAVLSIGISFLDFFGLMDGISWLNIDISTITLLLVGMVALFLAIERRNFLEGVEERLISGIGELLEKGDKNAQHVIDSLNGVAIRKFDNLSDAMIYVNQRLSSAKTSVDDTTFNPVRSPEWDLPHYRTQTREYYARAAKKSSKIAYREIYIFNRQSHIDNLKHHLEIDEPGYSCAYFPEKPKMSLLQFIIFDGEEIALISDQFSTLLAIRHPQIVSLFKEYYETLWKEAIIIKEGARIYKDVVSRITDEYDR